MLETPVLLCFEKCARHRRGSETLRLAAPTRSSVDRAPLLDLIVSRYPNGRSSPRTRTTRAARPGGAAAFAASAPHQADAWRVQKPAVAHR
jgi:hypothetical protein